MGKISMKELSDVMAKVCKRYKEYYKPEDILSAISLILEMSSVEEASLDIVSLAEKIRIELSEELDKL